MMTAAKVVLLLLVVFTATALENSHETDSDHELNLHSSPTPSPLSYPPSSSPSSLPILRSYETVHTPRLDCLRKCNETCEATQKTPFLVRICVGVCATTCPPHFLDHISCTLDCARSPTNSLRYDTSIVEDRLSFCYKQCKRD